MKLDDATMREIILDHYQYPRNRHLCDHYASQHMASESCIDDITVQADIKDGKINDICFDGRACTVSTASTSIMTELLKGKTIEQAKQIIHEYFNMVDQREYDDELLEEANAFAGVGKQANRIKCATIGWKAISLLINEEKKEG